MSVMDVNYRLIVVITSQCIHITNHCCTPETNTMLYVNYTSIKKIGDKKNEKK